MSTTTGQPRKTRASRRRREPDPAGRCPRCGEYLTVAWRGRLWCIVCDDAALFCDGREYREADR